MINNHKNVSAYTGPFPKDPRNLIIAGPIYQAQDVLNLCNADSIKFWSTGAITDAKKYLFDTAQMATLIPQILNSGVYQNSEFCQSHNGGPWVAADVYVMPLHRYLLPEMEYLTVNFYFKFAINITKKHLLMVSNHRENE